MISKYHASADSVANARLAKASQTLAPNEPQPAPNRIAGFLSELTPEELAELRKLLVV